MKTIKTDDLAGAVHDILEDYFDGIEDGSNKLVAEVAAETVMELKSTSPKRASGGGKYADSWNIKQTKKQKSANEITVYNKEGQLTHLLEHGHNIIRGGRVVGYAGAKPHIAKAEQHAIKKLLDGMKIVIERG